MLLIKALFKFSAHEFENVLKPTTAYSVESGSNLFEYAETDFAKC